MNTTAVLLRLSKWWAAALVLATFFFHYGNMALTCGRNGGALDFCELEAGIGIWPLHMQFACVPLGSTVCREYAHGLFFIGVGSATVQSLEASVVALAIAGCISAGVWQLSVALRERRAA